MKKHEIVKVQRELTGSDLVLIYNKDRSLFGRMPITPELELLMGSEVKAFFFASFTSDGQVILRAQAPAQCW